MRQEGVQLRARKGAAPARASDSSFPGADSKAQQRRRAQQGPPRPPPAPLSDRFILAQVWRQRRHLLLALLALLPCVATSLASPVLSGALFEALVRGQPFTQYGRLLALMLALYTAEPHLVRVYVRRMCQAGEGVQASLRVEAFRVLLSQKVEFFDTHGSAELAGLLSRDLDSVRGFVCGNVLGNRGLRGLVEAAGSVAVLFWLSWRLAPLLAGVILAGVAAAHLYRRQTLAVESAHAEAHARMAAAAHDTLSNIRTVRTFAGEGRELRRYGCHVAAALASGAGLAGARASLEGVNRSAVHLTLLSLYALGGYLITHGLMPLHTLVAATSFSWALVFACQGTLQTFADARHMLVSLRRVQAVLAQAAPDPHVVATLPGGDGAWANGSQRQPAPGSNGAASCYGKPWQERVGCSMEGGSSASEVPAAAAAACGGGSDRGSSGGGSNNHSSGAGSSAVEAARRGSLELRDVSFAYPSRPEALVLRGLCLTLPCGEVTALVGRSGAGKSTVASLLLRLYTLGSGGIYLGGRNILEYSRGDWVAAVTAVGQEPVLFAGSIAENIAYGRGEGEASQGDIEQAARAANAHDFICSLPRGYATLVGERGTLLSGGQRQRIALARALLHDSPIVLLDEATSALDAQSERTVQAAIETLQEGRTVLVIAHRLSTVQSADRIAVLEGGRIQETGSHAELVRRGAIYSQLVSQSLALNGAA